MCHHDFQLFIPLVILRGRTGHGQPVFCPYPGQGVAHHPSLEHRLPIPVTDGQTEYPVQAHIVYQHTGLLVTRFPQSPSHLLQIFYQGKCGTRQLHELHIGTVKTLGKDIHIDQHPGSSLLESLHQFPPLRSRSLAVDSYGLHPVRTVAGGYLPGMSYTDSIHNSFFSVGILLDTLIQPPDADLAVQHLIHFLHLIISVRPTFLQ